MYRALLASGCAVLVLVGCTHAPDGPRREDTYVEAHCPPDVETMVVPKHSCGYVIARSAAGGQVDLFVIQVEPPAPSTLAPVIETGSDLGTQPIYGGLVPIAQRTGRRLVIVDLQGTGHSTPLLDCPEVNALAATAAADPGGSATTVVDAIAACHERLTSKGVIPATVDIGGTAENLHAVTQALGIPRAVAMGHGTTGAVAIEWARRYPGEVQALVLDSPQLRDPSPGVVIDHLIDDVSHQCDAEAACRERYGDTVDLWPGVLRDLRRAPLLLSGDGGTVRVDDQALRRAVIWLTGGSNLGPSWIPALVAEAAARKPGVILTRYAGAVAHGPPLCLGYLPNCAGAPRVAVGAALSLNCPIVRDDPTWSEPCRAWGVTSTTPPSGPPLTTPTLVLMGRYDAFAPPDDVRAVVTRLIPGAFFVEDPAGAHNVLGGDCMRIIRSAWLAGPLTNPPETPACLQRRALVFD